MSYLVTCTFDLKNASRQDYNSAYADLSKLGLQKVVISGQNRQVVIPTTTVMGIFNATASIPLRNSISYQVKNAFAARGHSSEIFITVGGNDHTWLGTNT